MTLKDNLEKYVHDTIVSRVMIEVIITIVQKSLSKEDYENNKYEIFEQIVGQILSEVKNDDNLF